MRSWITLLIALYSVNTMGAREKNQAFVQIDQCSEDTEKNSIREIVCESTQPVILNQIVFRKNSSSVSPSARKFLDSLIKPLRNYSNIVFEVASYTDDLGPKKWNKRLSQKRADTVRLYLIFRGVRASQLIAIGYGEESPIADNHTREGRQKNRRIELRQIKH